MAMPARRLARGVRRFVLLFLYVAAWMAGWQCWAQTEGQVVDATQWQSGTVDLGQGWRVHEGDNPAWAEPGYDDSGWNPADLDNLGAAKPGWRWYRLRFRLAPGHPHEHLLVVGGEGVFAAYVNGQSAQDARLEPWYRQTRPVEEIIPLADGVDEYTLALRTHASMMYVGWHLPLFLTAAVGTADAIDNERISFESQRVYPLIPSMAINIIVVLAGIGAFALFSVQRAHAEYMWLGIYLLLLGVSNGLLYGSVEGVVPLGLNNCAADLLTYFCTIVQIEFTFCFAGQRVNRVWRVYQVLVLLTYLGNPLVILGWLQSSTYIMIQAAMILPAAMLLPVLLLVWYRKGNREAGWLIVPSLFPAATIALFDIGTASIFTGWGRLDFLANPIPVGPIPLQISDLADFLFVLAIGVVMFFRFTRVSREQSRAAAELEAAREVQQRLVPVHLPKLAGYALEAAYFPAQEVGGDFYQIFDQGDGIQMLVVGDVSGKGLKAAMTGTLALGALHTLASEGLGPSEVLTRLNGQLAESTDGGFITCICVQIAAEGEMRAACAGHLPPYRNGQEVAMPPDLPLGIAPGERYADCRFRMEPGDRLTLMSDGVVEATDAHGTLFGFERTRAISAQRAEAIARAAQAHGQEDDITVLTLERSATAALNGLEMASAAR